MIPTIFINCKAYPFMDEILNGRKWYETRNSDTLGRFADQRVLLAETGRGRPLVRCSAVIRKAVTITSHWKWENYYRQLACVSAGSKYDWHPDTTVKYCYYLDDVKPVAPAFAPEGKRHGRIWMECDNLPEKAPGSHRPDTVASFIEAFEDFLDEKGIIIQNDDKDLAIADGQDPETICNIYGTDYGNLSDRIEALLANLGALNSPASIKVQPDHYIMY